MTKMIPLTQGKFAKVDDCDYERISKHKWSMCGIYAHRVTSYLIGKPKNIMMHREIMSTPDGMETDHINGDGLDNRRANLRICTHAENARNQKIQRKSVSGYRGVTWLTRAGKWRAVVCVGERKIYVGIYENPRDAAIAYNEEAKKHFGEYAKLNNIE